VPTSGSPSRPQPLYLPLTPRAKNWPLQPDVVGIQALRDVLYQSPRIVFPSLFADQIGKVEIDAALGVVAALAADRDEVVWASFAERGNTSSTKAIRVEFCFGQRLLRRLAHYAERAGAPEFVVSALLDLLKILSDNSDTITMRADEFGNRWMVLRGEQPDSESALFKNGIVLAQQLPNLLRLIIGETEEDIDNWYRYEWLAPAARAFFEDRIKGW
jgi:hypothetical protein